MAPLLKVMATYPLVTVFSTILLSYWIVAKALTARREKLFAASHGCGKLKMRPQWDRLFGIDFFFTVMKKRAKGQDLAYFNEMFQDIGSTFGIVMMGFTLTMTNEPENIQTVLAKQFADFEIGESRSKGGQQMLGHGILNSDGESWERGRAMLRPSFVRSQVGDFDLFERNFQKLIDVVPADGSTVDIQEFLSRFTLDVGTEYFLGENCNMLQPNASEHCKQFAWAFNVGLEGIPARFRLGKFAKFYYDTRYNKACDIVHNYIAPIVKKAVERSQLSPAEKVAGLEKRGDKYVFLDSIIQKDCDEIEVRDQVLNVLSAARDTISSLMSSCIWKCTRYPEIMAKLRREVDLFEGRTPTYQEIKDMKYMNYMIKEILRLYPPVPFNARVATKNTCLPTGGGPDGKSPVFIKKGGRVVYQVFSTHRRRDIWGDDAEEFRPERWEHIRPGFGYLPFNGGPRICPGQPFALVEAAYVLTRLLQTYSVLESRDSSPYKEEIALTFSHKDGVLVAFGGKA
ncbi:hypothetical protein HBI56_068140 [Parastagonospora nodorum]|nr:hypothetical protein HBH53_129440 [Parastagonospora nodorum]KAH3974909.1 hypothetical protein HBH51_085410 [Parastagonospora nodorum]KAH3978026.1 hypothetical protein HBH52_107490 [Parastagonospora nodorum]KAH4001355.1 hypothetical protein HBI10_089170 [Parastagonospora nodorum]KAH4027377.1 hypothetical protein HBI13_058190 [Parastagonospora nodorum]